VILCTTNPLCDVAGAAATAKAHCLAMKAWEISSYLVSSAAPLLLRISDFPVIASCTSSDKTNCCSSSSTRKFSTGMLSSPGDYNTTVYFQRKI
jgi:hypothetical protein